MNSRAHQRANDDQYDFAVPWEIVDSHPAEGIAADTEQHKKRYLSFTHTPSHQTSPDKSFLVMAKFSGNAQSAIIATPPPASAPPSNPSHPSGSPSPSQPAASRPFFPALSPTPPPGKVSSRQSSTFSKSCYSPCSLFCRSCAGVSTRM
jgi:hypothetical protein